MFVPPVFACTDSEVLFSLIERFPFATLVGTVEGRPFASHLPFVLDRERRVLRAHMAAANPHARALRGEALVIIQGPNGYVSPSWYESAPQVPTWNYATVHVRGIPRIIEGREEAVRALRQLVAQHERSGWSVDELPVDFLDELLAEIVVFEVPIASLEGKLKLSQNRKPIDRAGVVAALARSEDPADRALATYMRQQAG